jgi:hypothetical protein
MKQLRCKNCNCFFICMLFACGCGEE